MEWVETTGRTVDEAKDAALDQLGVDEQDAEFEILEEPRLGLFGRVRAEARVRARVRPTRPRPKDDRRDRKRRKAGERRNGNGDRGPTVDKGAPTTTEKREPRKEATQVDEDVPMTEQAEVARQFLLGLLDELEASADVAVNPIDDETIEVAVTGGDLGLLIGPKGATLNALQELTRTVVQRRTGGRNGRLLVDVSGYRQKRREALERFARQVAAGVQETGERRILEPMHPADRKVVHDTVNELPGVRTTSEGEEPRRRVVILPE
jgi:spoIIIJ-associated protein